MNIIYLLLSLKMAHSPENFALTGTITTQSISYIVLSYEGIKGIHIEDTCPVNRGKFAFYGSIDNPTYAFLRGYTSKGSNDNLNSTGIFLEQSTLQVTLKENDFADAVVRGSKTQLEMDSLKPFRHNINSHEASIAFISTYGEALSDMITNRKLSAVGNPAPIFSMPDIHGRLITLETFRHKSYVLLDFWASWCVPCRALTPTIMNMYKKYHDRGLEVIEFSYDKDTASMCQAIRQDSTGDWCQIYLNMYHTTPDEESGKLLKKYAIESIPSLILIDKEGKIIGRYRGNGDEGGEQALYQKLSVLFEN